MILSETADDPRLWPETSIKSPEVTKRSLAMLVLITAVVIVAIVRVGSFLSAASQALPPGLLGVLSHFQIVGSWGSLLVLVGLALAALAGGGFASALGHYFGWSRWGVLRAGFTIVITVSVIGISSVNALIANALSRPLILGELLVFAIAGAACSFLLNRHAQLTPEIVDIRPTPTIRNNAKVITVFAICVAALSDLFLLLVVLATPVLTSVFFGYHAELARYWFTNAPHPGVVVGPSVGLQLSSNYPPLFSATGAAMHLLSGGVHDIYLRLISPILFIGVQLIVYGAARRHSTYRIAAWALLLTVGCPLLSFFAFYPTNYMLLSALVTAAAVLAFEYVAYRITSAALLAAVFLGLANLTDFYGWLITASFVIALLLVMRSFRVAFLVGAIAVGILAPWLIRNAIAVGNPVFPWLNSVFKVESLNTSLFHYSRNAIRSEAIDWWTRKNGLKLWSASAVLIDKQLVFMTLVPGLVAAWLPRYSRSRRMIFLTLTVVLFVFAIWLPGHFWLRSLVTILPLAALLCGVVAARELSSFDQRAFVHRFRYFVIFVWKRLIILSAVACIAVIALTTAISPPIQGKVTTQLSASSQILNPEKHLGDARTLRWINYGGDSVAWEWLNAHAQPNQIATFEVRTYRLKSANVFYLDGKEAEPLYAMTTAKKARDYLTLKGIKYVFIPGWAKHKSTSQDFAIDHLPMEKFLGTVDFPMLASFAPKVSSEISNVYAVGGTVQPIQAALYPSSVGPVPSIDGSGIFPAGSNPGHVLTEVKGAGNFHIEIENASAGKVNVSFTDLQTGRLLLDEAVIERHGTHGWIPIDFPFTGTGVVDFQLQVHGSAAHVRAARIILAVSGPS